MILCSRDSVCKSLRSLLYLRYCALFPPCKAFEQFVFNRSEIALDVFAFVVVLLFFSGRKTFYREFPLKYSNRKRKGFTLVVYSKVSSDVLGGYDKSFSSR